MDRLANVSAAENKAPGRDFVITPVILSGGTGSRLWPVSRQSFPKQFWPLVSENSLIQDTALRAAGAGFAAPIMVCNEDHRFLVAEHLRDIGVADARIILEPVGRNSAPAIAAAALLAAEDDPSTVLWMLAADAAIKDVSALHGALGKAYAAARAGHFVTFGITADKPETGYGYIEVGPALEGLSGVHNVSRFLEKPERAGAVAMLEAGGYLWNSGMFVFTAQTLLEEMRIHAPEVLAAARRALTGRRADLDFIRLEPKFFAECPDISLDYAVAEHTERAVVVPADIGWSDVGSWDALWALGTKDEAGNVAHGDVLLQDARNCYVRSDGMLTAVLGVSDAVVVTTEDAVLVLHRDQAQNVKRIVEHLKASKRHEGHAHNRMYRPWGFYEQLIQGERFQVKRIYVNPGSKLSLQKHFNRAEHWVVVAGTALVTRDESEMLLRENESVYLPLGCVHRLENPGKIPLLLIEVQSGGYLGEDDIVRIEDNYGRQ
ncbi:MAG: mannose-1-phosphate guanylyltransferase/mannose-6-phosphate isomerase [Acidocella sp.]|nr:mannose-1-phosphate guanylyltransferase/mannose-6-phosphate isomerase [Acidocella sp.]